MFRELLRMIPGFERRLMESSEEDVIHIADMVFFVSFVAHGNEHLTSF